MVHRLPGSWHVGSSPTRDRARAPRVNRWIFIHCATREVPRKYNFWEGIFEHSKDQIIIMFIDLILHGTRCAKSCSQFGCTCGLFSQKNMYQSMYRKVLPVISGSPGTPFFSLRDSLTVWTPGWRTSSLSGWDYNSIVPGWKPCFILEWPLVVGQLSLSFLVASADFIGFIN